MAAPVMVNESELQKTNKNQKMQYRIENYVLLST